MLTLLARGVVETHRTAVEYGIAPVPDQRLPHPMRRAMALASRDCLENGVQDLGASLHELLAATTRSAAEIGIPCLADPAFTRRDVVLTDPDLAAPTPECRALAAPWDETSAAEEREHERLRRSLEHLGPGRGDAYRIVREFVVRNPITTDEALNGMLLDAGLALIAGEIRPLYRRVPSRFLQDGVLVTCANCGSVLAPHPDTAAWPDGRCRIARCRRRRPDPAPGRRLEATGDLLLATNAALAYWVGPGLDEIALHDALTAAGVNAALYPREDAADVGVDGLEVGIDVKAWSSPVALAERLSRGLGRLALFARAVVAVPDDRLEDDPDHLDRLAWHYRGDEVPEFTTVSRIEREFTR